MHNNFYISDTHFGHSNMITFLNAEGNRVRPFSSIEEMDELMVENWNKVVRPKGDTVYHLGDVVINRRCLAILKRLNGRKVLIKGNHDIFKLSDYTPYFEDIRAYKVLPASGIIFSHIPIHDNQLNSRFKWNCHGHLHQKFVDDRRYLNLCVENINYTPIEFEEIMEILNGRQ